MKKAHLIFLLQIFCLLTITSACAQEKNKIVKLHAFRTETGGEDNTSVDHIHYLFAETTGKFLPQWNTVYTNKGVFAIEAEEIEASKAAIGTLKSSEETVNITAKRGNRLWYLLLIPMKASIPANVAALLKNNEVVVVTEWNSKQSYHPVSKEIVLQTVNYK